MNGQVPVLAEPLFNLRSDTTHDWGEQTKGRAPHKPFLILSILDGISERWIDSPKIIPTQTLADHFFEYWDQIMGEDQTTTVALPFFHMKSASFWHLKYNANQEPFSYSPSWGAVKERVEYAEIDHDLFTLFMDEGERDKIRSKLFETYFSDEASVTLNKVSSTNTEVYRYSETVLSLAADPFVSNHAEHQKTYYREVHQQIRHSGFSKAIRANYSDTCAVCKDKVITPSGKTLVEGAHIIPWSDSKNDDPRNGLSLCPTHHWMFDQFMITIRNDFSIRISKWLVQGDTIVRDLEALKDTILQLPTNKKFYPAEDALQYHYKQFEKAHKDWR